MVVVVGEWWYNEIAMNAPLPPLSEQAKNLKQGIYEHYKGHQYRVLGVARHSETLEELVVYQAQYGDRNFWVRPIAMFCEAVEINGTRQPRFRFLHD